MPSDRVRVTHAVTLKPGATEDFLAAYQRIRELVMSGRFGGHISHQLCHGTDAEDRWLITSEWSTEEDYDRWESDPEHREATMPLRGLFAEAARPSRYRIEQEDTH